LGASAAITGATLGPLTISSDGKTATAVLSHTEVEETKTIEGIDTSEAYNIGANSVTISGSWDGTGTYTAKTSAGKPVSTTIGIWGNSGTSKFFTVSAGVSGSGYA
jgi:hypothetical protein